LEEVLLQPTAEETRRRWQQLERDVAKALEGWQTPGSGNKKIKGDARTYLFAIECKYRFSQHQSGAFVMPLDLQWLEAIWRQAMEAHRVPVLALEWGDGTRALLLPLDYYQLFSEDEPHAMPTKNRIVNLTSVGAYSPIVLDLHSIEVPEHRWVLVPWDDLATLRSAELSHRAEIGREKKPTAWKKRPFPSRQKGWRR
jgi:hypothetical protein